MANNLLFSSLLLSFAFILVVYSDDIRHYDGYTVLRLTPKNESQMRYLHDLEENNLEIDFWQPPTAINRFVDMMIPPHLKSIYEKVLIEKNIVHKTLIENVEKNLAEERAAQKSSTRMDWDSYQRLAEIQSFLNTTASANPTIAQVDTIGKSTENRDIRIIKIGEGVGNNNKPIIFMDAGIHAREWIGPATVTYIIDQLIQGYNQGDANIKPLLQKFDWYIVPVSNPDGYEYTHTNERMWRKTRSANAGSTCIGTDPNRNFGYEWGGLGTSDNPCSETFKGSAAFSEPETKALSDYILARKDRVELYTAVHSYGQWWLYPWGYDRLRIPDESDVDSLGLIATNALKQSYGTSYTLGNSAILLYPAAGAADDWAYGAAGIKYSYTVELRDTGSNGFILPPAQIKPCAIETLAGYIAMAKDLENRV